jgi:hypothetical protein
MDTDAIPEFHSARILVLLATCGEGSPRRIAGRTKLAKLDFFLRYPSFLARALDAVQSPGPAATQPRADEPEAPMIRYRYGPWDPRYGAFIGLLEARGLVRVGGSRVDTIALTGLGSRTAARLLALDEFSELGERGERLGAEFASWTGSALKDLVYELFPHEVGDLRMRERIRP